MSKRRTRSNPQQETMVPLPRHTGWMTIAAAAVLAACTANPAPQDAPSAPPGPTPATTPPVAGSPGGTMAPPRRPPEMPAPDARLVRLRAEPLNGRGYAQLGLSGANKPNGLEYRLRQEVPSERPAYLKAELDGLQLFIADSTADGWMGFYRGPLGGGPNSGNVAYRAVMYRRNGSRAWDTNLNLFLSRTDHLEVQDVRYANGRLYFNEACQSYSREAGGACSSLLAVDPVAGTVAWRTPPRTSNNIILLHGPYVVAGYGFTAEPDSLFLVDRATGRILDRQPLDSAAGYLEVTGEELVVVTTNQLYYFRIQPR